ncbi:MAG: DUF1698 domain-containing protein [Saprospiraceae bacterium]|nr:DUF1698 domain-containing protein [Saprospiraceae bacterium]
MVASCGLQQNGQDQIAGDKTSWSEESEFEEKVSTYEDENRDIWQKPDRVIHLLGPLEDKTVVDIGAGTGYFAFRLLAEADKVIAVEIDPEFVTFLEAKRAQLPTRLQRKFDVRLAQPDDPNLALHEADAVLLVNTYAYMQDRVNYFQNLKSKLSEHAKVVIIEFKMKEIPNGPPDDEKVEMKTIMEELKLAGYSDILSDDRTLDYQYIVTARSSL